jgi:hypothetical protein
VIDGGNAALQLGDRRKACSCKENQPKSERRRSLNAQHVEMYGTLEFLAQTARAPSRKHIWT